MTTPTDTAGAVPPPPAANPANPVHHGHPGIVDPSANPFLTGAFAPGTDEVDLPDLQVIGEIPADMDGVYLRNGPNPRFTPLGSYFYPLDGDGMVHAMRIADGRAAYSNRFVRTPALEVEERAGRALWPGLMSGGMPNPDDVGPELAHHHRDMPDINIVRHGGRILALAESGTPFCMAPDLSTIGRETFDGHLPLGMTAHPKIDPLTGEMVLFRYMIEAPFLTWSVMDQAGRVTRDPTPVPGVDRSMMIHDMAITRTVIVLVLSPLFFDVMAARRGGSLLSWEPGLGTRIAIIPRDGSPVRWASTDAFWIWHTANAFDVTAPDGSPDPHGRVTIDFVQYNNPGMGLTTDPDQPALVRATINPTTGTIIRDTIEQHAVEFPRIDDRLIGSRHDVIAVGSQTGRLNLPTDPYDAIRWFSLERGWSVEWIADGLLVGEPAFVPRPHDPDPDHGWWVTFATDPAGSASWFLVIPAADPASGPVARVRIPVRVPLGLHGNWLPTEE